MHNPLLATFPAVDGSNVLVNLTDKCLPVRSNLTKQQLAAAIADFRATQYKWIMDIFCTETIREGIAGQPLIYAYTGWHTATDGGIRWLASASRLAALPPAALKIVGCGRRSTPVQIGRSILSLSVKDQQRVFRSSAGSFVHSISRVITHKRSLQYCAVQLEEMLQAANSVQAFIDEIYHVALVDRSLEKETYTRCIVYDALLLYLADRELVLRPFLSAAFLNFDTRVIERLMMTSFSNQCLQDMRALFDTEQKERGNVSFEVKWDRQHRPHIITLFASSTFRRPVDLSAELFEALRDALKAGFDATNKTATLAWIFKTFRSAHSSLALRNIFSVRRGSRPFEWIDVAFTSKTNGLFPSKDLEGYKPKAFLKPWVEVFDQYLPTLKTKTIASHVTTFNTFLTWLAVADVGVAHFESIKRAHINDYGLASPGLSFRSYLVQKGIQAQHFNVILKRMLDFFDAQILRYSSAMRNPFHYNSDRMQRVTYRAKTTRSAMTGYVLEMIREFNGRGDFQFSRGRPAHYRIVTDQTTQTICREWFPAPALIIDFLLTLPVRSFQARFLDSGEGDDFSVDFTDASLSVTRSTSPLRQRGRREGALCAVSSFGMTSMVGLYINTNKTSSDRESGYEIPWCGDDIKKNLLRMRAWQERFNPVSGPVICAERHSVSRNPEVLARIKTTFALFRDPDDENMPVTREALSRYWDDLLRAVELDQEAGEDGDHDLSLTEPVELNKGGNKRESRFKARFDLHSLRVSGITALIEAGLPPDLVMQVVGHATIVMTLYYNKMQASDVNARLRAAIERTAAKLSSGSADSDDEIDEIISSLTNMRAAEHRAGQTLLAQNRGCGNGSIIVMSHGICPGGDCQTGGEFINASTGYRAVPRALACSLCRYRLTSPAFLPGLVLNANRLIHELRESGEQIGALNAQLRNTTEKAQRSMLRSQIEALYREIEIVAMEWGAEYGYIQKMQAILATPSADGSSNAIVSHMPAEEAKVRVEKRSSFALMQNLVEGAQDWIVFKPHGVIQDHREFLNEVLAANNVAPFLIRMRGDARDIAACNIGAAIVSAIPDSDIDMLRDGTIKLADYPTVFEVVKKVQLSVKPMNTLPEANLLVVQRQLVEA